MKLRVSILPLLLVVTLFLSDRSVVAGICDPCASTVSAPAGVVFACPQRDSDAFGGSGLTISVTVVGCLGNPVVGIPATDIWLVGCSNLLTLCGGRGISATGPTDANGHTTIEGVIGAGGCDNGGLRVVAQGVVLLAGVCGEPCLPIQVRSPDVTGNLIVDLADFAFFGAGYTSPPKVYNECLDFVSPFGSVGLVDFAKFGTHYFHAC